MKSDRKACHFLCTSQTNSPKRIEIGEFGHKSKNATEVNSGPIRILLVDDHPVLRKGMLAYLSDHARISVVGEAGDGLDAIQKAGELSPDLILMDIGMPKMDGLTATRSICQKFPKIKVLILSMHDKPDYVVQAIQMGARGFVLKSSSSEELIKAIEIVLRGEPFFSERPASAIKNNPLEKVGEPNLSSLFEREKEVLIHLVAGYSNKEIAVILKLSVRTVESHRGRLMKKLNIHTTAGLTRYAVAHGLISLNPQLDLAAIPNETIGTSPASGLRI